MTKKMLVGVVVAAAAGVWMAWPEAAPVQPTDDAPAVENRIWIERMPDNPRDKFDVFVMIEDANKPKDPGVGVFSRTSAFEGDFSAFSWWRKEDGKFRILMLQKKKAHRLRARTSTRGCEPFDYCLKLDGAPRGSRKYGSMREWVIEPGAHPSPQALLDRARHLAE